MKRLFFLILFLPVVMFGQSVSTQIKTDRIYSKIGRGISIYDTLFLKKLPLASGTISGVLVNMATGRILQMPFTDLGDSLNLSGFALLADSSQWERDAVKKVIYPKNITDKVGIGTNSPAHTLDVNGRIYADSIQMVSPNWWMDGFRKRPFYFAEMLWGAVNLNGPWLYGVISTATITPNGVAEHPGALFVQSSATTNCGLTFYTNVTAIAGVTGDERTNLIAYPMVQDSTTLRFGFLDVSTYTEPTDGVYMETVPDSIIYGKTASGGTRSTTSTGYTLTKNIWYRFEIVVNVDATRVDYYVYNMADTELWHDALSTNIPGTGQLTGHGFVCTKQTNGSATGLKPNFYAFDYMDLYLGTLSR